VFTVCNWDWVTFRTDRELAMGIADIVAWELDIPDTVIPPVENGTDVIPSDTHDIINIVDKLKVRAVTKAVIHHSGGRQRPAKVRRHIRAIARYHVRHKHWSCIGYDYIFDADGNIYHVNRDQIVNYHAGDWQTNLESLGFCFLGMEPTPEQLDAMRWLIRRLGITEVIPHKAVKRTLKDGSEVPVKTACPGQWGRWKDQLT